MLICVFSSANDTLINAETALVVLDAFLRVLDERCSSQIKFIFLAGIKTITQRF